MCSVALFAQGVQVAENRQRRFQEDAKRNEVGDGGNRARELVIGLTKAVASHRTLCSIAQMLGASPLNPRFSSKTHDDEPILVSVSLLFSLPKRSRASYVLVCLALKAKIVQVTTTVIRVSILLDYA